MSEYNHIMRKRRIPRYQEEENRQAVLRRGRIVADLSKQAPSNSYSRLLFYDVSGR